MANRVTPVRKRKTPIVIKPMNRLCSVDGGLDGVDADDDYIAISDEDGDTIFKFEVEELANYCGVRELGAFNKEDKNLEKFTNFEEVLTSVIKKMVQTATRAKGMKTIMAVCNEDEDSVVMRKAIVASGCFVDVKRWTNTNGSKLTMYVSNN